MNATVGFLSFLVLTLIALGGVFVTGRQARRRRHIPLVVVTVAFLGTTIYFAEKLGEGLDLDEAGRIVPIHLTLAKLATLAYLVPVITGLATIRNSARRKLHGRVALVVLLLTVLAAATGAWMVFTAPALSSSAPS